MFNSNKIKQFALRRAPWLVVGLVVALTAGVYLVKSGSKTAGSGTTFTARRGPLDITVLEGGSLQALESQEAKCEVRVGYQGIKILKIVEEGYQVTEEDVRTNKILVELDSSEIRNKITQQDITFESTAASLVDAQQAYDIQLNQNASDVKAAEQKAKFARMDFDKFLGDRATQAILDELGPSLDTDPTGSTNGLNLSAKPAAHSIPAKPLTQTPSNGVPVLVADVRPGIRIDLSEGVETLAREAPSQKLDLPLAPLPAPDEPAPTNAPAAEPKKINLDFSKYASLDLLGDGEAKQKIRKFDDDLQVAQKEFGQAKSTLEGTQRLFGKGFSTRTELANDEIKLENARLKVQTAETARGLFLKYEFPKSAEEFLSKYLEAVRELDRARKGAVSKLAQAEAKLKSAEGRYGLELRQRKELNDQLEKCLIHAKKPGLVVYGGGGEEMYYYGDQERIREGATVRERQAIITIPDMTKMAVKVKIHETYIKKVKKGQRVRITVDAFPDKVLEGEVIKVGVLPDSQNRWMNPDLKVYLTTIAITGVHDWVKPGMTAKAEIMVNRLPSVVYVPMQAVVPIEGKQYAYVVKPTGREKREVEVGEFNDEFIEIKKGLKEGEKVALQAPEKTGHDAEGTTKGPEKGEGDTKAKSGAQPAGVGPKPNA
jgi:multidrug efflux pump subunit AcrA (membrane-fusion protein)